MKKVAISEDDECWNIAKSMIEAIELMRETKSDGSSSDGRTKVDFRGLIMKRMMALTP